MFQPLPSIWKNFSGRKTRIISSLMNKFLSLGSIQSGTNFGNFSGQYPFFKFKLKAVGKALLSETYANMCFWNPVYVDCKKGTPMTKTTRLKTVPKIHPYHLKIPGLSFHLPIITSKLSVDILQSTEVIVPKITIEGQKTLNQPPDKGFIPMANE